MFDFLENYEQQGHFFFERGDRLSQVSRDVPEAPGVYLIYRLAHGSIDLVYIGKSGTLLQDGSFRNQLLRKRLNNQQEKGIKRQTFFDQKMKEDGIEAFDIYWYVTFDENHFDLPGFVEGQLIQAHFDVFGTLPEWNREY